MTTVVPSIRSGFSAACLALGLLALAVLTRTVLVSGFYFDLSDPAALLKAPLHHLIANNLLSNLFPIFSICLVLLVGTKELLRQKANAKDLLICLCLGIFFGLFVNLPVHNYLVSIFMSSDPTLQNEVPLMDFGRAFVLLGVGFALSCILVPISEELLCRGLLFDETKNLPRLHTAFWSLLMFCFAHYLTFGLTKVVAVIPMAIVFIVLRFRYGSWKHSAAAHMGVNSVATAAEFAKLTGLF
jgi:membrane protease YdiL (CAAX protease family)